MDALPTLAVLFGYGSAPASEIAMAAEDLCELVFISDLADPYVRRSLPLLESIGPVLPAADEAGTGRELRRAEVSGVVAFADPQLPAAARFAADLGLPYHDPDTAARLCDKYLQRSRLQEHGVPGARFRSISGPQEVDEALIAVGAPAVLKPRAGAGSRNTVAVETAAELAAAVRTCVAAGDGELILEERLIGEPTIAGPRWGDYVSVESLLTGGVVRHLGVTGKPPLAEPFRETGAFYPHTLSSDVVRQVCDTAGRALAALGVTEGMTHTELKLTADGPRVIEVNGRLGGYVDSIIKQVTGESLLRLAMATALGRADRAELPPASGVAYQFHITPPVWATAVADITGINETRALPGVRRVEVTAASGDAVDWRQGTGSAVAVVHGVVPDHEALAAVHDEIGRTLLVDYSRRRR